MATAIEYDGSGQAVVRFQGVGRFRAVPVETLEPGQLLVWNYSVGEYEVVSVTPASEKFVVLAQKNRQTGEVYTRKYAKGRLIGVTV